MLQRLAMSAVAVAEGSVRSLVLAATVAACVSLTACSATGRGAPGSIPDARGLAGSGVRSEDGRTLPNLTASRDAVAAYHDDGTWERQITAVAKQARKRLDEELATSTRPALVLDIDDTALSTYAVQKDLGFGWVPPLWDRWVREEVAPAHPAILSLYRDALEQGVAVFFVTGRREHLRAATERQLRAAGYDRWVALYLKPDDYAAGSVVPYKAGARRQIEEQGFEILVNVGDQWSDLEGGHARSAFKLPNPLYYRP